ncbi:hypothetical protein HPB47_011349 [Ixodes persulcatus]|uniref:Uncharacterized protein n=1 Tax=Ixodes persulcatus TaxID=34615 RepID=A0AC60NWJ4_IXOPE|nr:hypothetical protein HPB47_011349 [Ixodes persulcatus]
MDHCELFFEVVDESPDSPTQDPLSSSSSIPFDGVTGVTVRLRRGSLRVIGGTSSGGGVECIDRALMDRSVAVIGASLDRRRWPRTSGARTDASEEGAFRWTLPLSGLGEYSPPSQIGGKTVVVPFGLSWLA